MNAKKIKELKGAADGLLAGEITPVRVYTLEADGKGGFVRRHIDPEKYRQRQAAAAAQTNETKAARAKLNLSQKDFARLLGVSIDTLQNWEQGRRQPRGAAKVLLRLATKDPAAVLAAAA